MRQSRVLRKIALGVKTLLRHKLQSLLTMLGVVFGVASLQFPVVRRLLRLLGVVRASSFRHTCALYRAPLCRACHLCARLRLLCGTFLVSCVRVPRKAAGGWPWRPERKEDTETGGWRRGHTGR